MPEKDELDDGFIFKPQIKPHTERRQFIEIYTVQWITRELIGIA